MAFEASEERAIQGQPIGSPKFIDGHRRHCEPNRYAASGEMGVNRLRREASRRLESVGGGERCADQHGTRNRTSAEPRHHEPRLCRPWSPALPRRRSATRSTRPAASAASPRSSDRRAKRSSVFDRDQLEAVLVQRHDCAGSLALRFRDEAKIGEGVGVFGEELGDRNAELSPGLCNFLIEQNPAGEVTHANGGPVRVAATNAAAAGPTSSAVRDATSHQARPLRGRPHHTSSNPRLFAAFVRTSAGTSGRSRMLRYNAAACSSRPVFCSNAAGQYPTRSRAGRRPVHRRGRSPVVLR